MTTDLFPTAVSEAPSMRVPSNLVKAVWLGERVPASLTDDPTKARDYWFTHVTGHPWFDADKEHLAVLLLNTKMQCFAWSLISIGSLNETIAHPREILRPAIAASAYAMVLMHNHPSGDTAPSDGDRRVTNMLAEAGKLMRLTLSDHVIVGTRPTDRHFSFREAGML